MIISENIDLQLDFPITSEKIENALSDKGRKPLRWAIVAVNDKTFTLSISYEKLC